MKNALRLILPALLLAAFAAGCTSTAPDVVDLSRRVVFDSATDTTGGKTGPLGADHSSIVVRSDAEWQALWYALHNNNGTGDPPGVAAPPVDFTREMVIGVGVGRRANGCYSAKISEIADVDGQRVVVAKEVSSDGCAGMTCSQTPVSPVLIVVVERTDLQVYFQWRAETVCP